jgi:hypothetical protein
MAMSGAYARDCNSAPILATPKGPLWALNGQSRLTRDRPLSSGGDIQQLLDEVEKQQFICKGKSKFFTRSHGL